MKPVGKKIKLSIKAFIVVAVFFMAVAGHVPIAMHNPSVRSRRPAI
jgi:hypothetical protein